MISRIRANRKESSSVDAALSSPYASVGSFLACTLFCVPKTKRYMLIKPAGSIYLLKENNIRLQVQYALKEYKIFKNEWIK